jgi:hypothetical protein
MRRPIIILCLAAALPAPALAEPAARHRAAGIRERRSIDPVRERQFERRFERLRDNIERREQNDRTSSKGAFNADGSRRRFYDNDDN